MTLPSGPGHAYHRRQKLSRISYYRRPADKQAAPKLISFGLRQARCGKR